MRNIFFTFVVILSVNTNAQNWLKIDSIFNPTGVVVKNFSAPSFADLNNDGSPDLILGNINDEADFYWNNSNSFPTTFTKDTFVLSYIYSDNSLPKNSDYPVFPDLDTDGLIDLVIGGFNGLLFYKNAGTIYEPDFLEGDSIFENVNSQIGTDAKPAFVDVDNDGDLDLFVGIGESLLGGPTAGITLSFRNTGTANKPEFTLDNSLSTGISDIGLNSYPTFADLDNDGDFDLLMGRDLQTFVYYKNTGTKENPSWTLNTSLFSGIENKTYWKDPAFVDLDYDNDFDLVYGTSDGILYVYRNVGNSSTPSFQYYADYFKVIKLNGNGATVSFADFDNDGDQDLLSGIWSGKFVYFRNDGTNQNPKFKNVTSAFSNFTVNSYSTPVFVDIDSDGDFDIVSGATNGQVYLYINNNGVFVQNTTMFSSIDVGYSSIPSFADLDNDGDLDLLVGSETGSMTKYFTNDGNNVFQEDNNVFSNVNFPNYGRPVLADVDNDFDFDLVIGDGWGKIFFYRNEGDRTTPLWIRDDALFDGIESKQNTHPGFADLDGDSRKDMIIGEYDGNFTFYKNLFSPTSVETNELLNLSSFELSQNYPNPFNPTTVINYSVPSISSTGRQTKVSLVVYDILGREIAVLVNEFQPAGKYEVVFDIEKTKSYLSSGIYFYRLTIDSFSETMKMILMK